MTVNPQPNEPNVADLVVSLLLQFDWSPADRSPGQPYEIWTNSFLDSQILVPIDPSKADFDQLLQRAYRTLVYEQGTEVEQAAERLLVVRRSVLTATRWSKESYLDTGMIQWNVGHRLHEVAHDALAAAAKASQKVKRYFGNSSPYIARKLIEATLMGQSELGSYVVTAYVPSNDRFFFSQNAESAKASKLIDVESRSGAEIIDKLEEVVSATRGKLDEYRSNPQVAIFEEIVPVGLSHEMAVALASLADRGEGRVSISRISPLQQLQASTVEYSFNPTEALVLERVGESLRLTAEPEPVNLVGEVTLLEHVANVGEHTVRLHVANQPRIRTVRMVLSPEQYEVAIDAHRNDLPLRASGQIEKQGNYNWLANPTRVRIISDASNDDEDFAEEDEDPDQDPLF